MKVKVRLVLENGGWNEEFCLSMEALAAWMMHDFDQWIAVGGFPEGCSKIITVTWGDAWWRLRLDEGGQTVTVTTDYDCCGPLVGVVERKEDGTEQGRWWRGRKMAQSKDEKEKRTKRLEKTSKKSKPKTRVKLGLQ